MHLCYSVREILDDGRKIWPDKMDVKDILIAMGVVYGDLCRNIRDQGDPIEMEKEMGNLIVSTIRWCDDLGFNPEDCVKRAMIAQHVLANKKKR